MILLKGSYVLYNKFNQNFTGLKTARQSSFETFQINRWNLYNDCFLMSNLWFLSYLMPMTEKLIFEYSRRKWSNNDWQSPPPTLPHPFQQIYLLVSDVSVAAHMAQQIPPLWVLFVAQIALKNVIIVNVLDVCVEQPPFTVAITTLKAMIKLQVTGAWPVARSNVPPNIRGAAVLFSTHWTHCPLPHHDPAFHHLLMVYSWTCKYQLGEMSKNVTSVKYEQWTG